MSEIDTKDLINSTRVLGQAATVNKQRGLMDDPNDVWQMFADGFFSAADALQALQADNDKLREALNRAVVMEAATPYHFEPYWVDLGRQALAANPTTSKPD